MDKKNMSKEVLTSKECIQRLLDRDVVAEVEDAIKMGEQLTDVDLLRKAIWHNAVKSKVLELSGDIAFGTKLPEYVRIITANGFELTHKFPHNKEHVYVYVHKADGLVLVFDTYTPSYDAEISVNSGNLYFCWNSNEGPKRTIGSGGWESQFNPDWRRDPNCYVDGKNVHPTDLTWFGYIDCREALIHQVNTLRSSGTFCNPWPSVGDRMHLRLATSGDYYTPEYKDCDGYPEQRAYIDGIHNKRLGELPDWVLTMVGVE